MFCNEHLSADVYPFLMMMMTAPSRRMRTTRPPAHTPRIRPISSECWDTSRALRWSLQAARSTETQMHIKEAQHRTQKNEDEMWQWFRGKCKVQSARNRMEIKIHSLKETSIHAHKAFFPRICRIFFWQCTPIHTVSEYCEEIQCIVTDFLKPTFRFNGSGIIKGNEGIV